MPLVEQRPSTLSVMTPSLGQLPLHRPDAGFARRARTNDRVSGQEVELRANFIRQFKEPGPDHIVRIAISQAAFEAIAATLPLGSVGYENETNERGERLIWLDHRVVSRLGAVGRTRGNLRQRCHPANRGAKGASAPPK